MEVNSLKLELSTGRGTDRVSSFEIEPNEFKRWLNESTPERRLRIDTPMERTAIAPLTITKSVYGFCQPIETVLASKPKNVPSQDTIQPPLGSVEKLLRLCRLLEKQQEWYDARQEARSRAEEYLDIIEQHQKQWLNHRPSTKPEKS